MKKRGYFIGLILATWMLFPSTIFAACDYSEQVKLSSEAANVKFNYEAGLFKTGELLERDDILLPDDENDVSQSSNDVIEAQEPGVKLHVLNLTKNLYVVITNDYDGSTETYYYEDSDEGTIDWERPADMVLDKVVYTLEVYAVDSTCKDGSLRTITLETPRYNELSEYSFCENSKEYFCEAFTTLDFDISFEEAYKKISGTQTNPKEEPNGKEGNGFFEQYGIYILVGLVALVIIGVVTYVIIRKTQRSTIK